ncbi:MAG: hypothetical protein EB076_04265 [Flavobacteriia bacterium]|nr:hypothetical protein [Flavobacteriia bacterium]
MTDGIYLIKFLFLKTPNPHGSFFVKAVVYSPSFLRTPNGKYKGYPFRTKVEGEQLLGYSDHFTVYILLGRK